MTSQHDEYQYLFDKGFMEVTKEGKEGGNHQVRPTKKFFDALAEQVVLLSTKLSTEDPDVFLAYATKEVVQQNDKDLPNDPAVKFGCYLYTFLKDSNVYKDCLEIIQEHQQFTKVEKITKPCT